MVENNQRGITTIQDEKKFIASLGGSVLFGGEKNQEKDGLVEFDYSFVIGMIGFLKSLSEEDYITAVIVGGGEIARARRDDVKKFGGDHDESDIQLDYIGIGVSETNAAALLAILLKRGIVGERLRKEQIEFEAGKIYLRGGTEPGHTTDFVAVEAAIKTNSPIVVNISNTPGLHPLLADGGLDETRLIQEVSLNEYIKKFAVEHEAGVNTPFDIEAAKLARDNGVTIILVGNGLENIEKMTSGEPFVGTILR